MKQFFTWMTSKRALPFPIFLYSLRVIFQFRSHSWDGTNRFCTHTEKGNAVYVSLWYLHLLWLPRLDQNCCRPHLKLNNLNLWLLDKTDIHGHMEREHLWKIFEIGRIAKNHNSVCNGNWLICHYRNPRKSLTGTMETTGSTLFLLPMVAESKFCRRSWPWPHTSYLSHFLHNHNLSPENFTLESA